MDVAKPLGGHSGKPRYPCLEKLLGCYFHDSWMEEAPCADAVIEIYLSEWSRHEIPLAVLELRQLLEEGDDAIEQQVQAMGCHYDPPEDGLSFRQWLEHVERQLSTHLERTCN